MSGLSLEGYRWVSNELWDKRNQILGWNPSFRSGPPKPGKHTEEELVKMGLKGVYRPVDDTQTLTKKTGSPG